MTERPPFEEMLLVGAEGRNAGKTTLACAVISRFRRDAPVIGLKITTVRHGKDPCPRGGKGCGACASLQGDFCITEETDSASGKDTARMLEAGAQRVFWARATEEGLGGCLAELRAQLGAATPIVAESNSAARLVEPGVFLMVRERGAAAAKPSSRRVLAFADRIVLSDGASFDLDLADLQLRDGQWRLRGPSAAVLAGGGSSRMGVDKCLLEIGGVPLVLRIIERLRSMFREVLVSAGGSPSPESLGVPVVRDPSPGQGPLMGIAAALQAASADIVFIMACDIPEIDERLVRRLLRAVKEADCAVPRRANGTWEPLFAAWRRTALPSIHQVLSSGRRKIDAVFPLLELAAVDIGDEPWMRNLNTPEDVAAYLASMSASS